MGKCGTLLSNKYLVKYLYFNEKISINRIMQFPNDSIIILFG